MTEATVTSEELQDNDVDVRVTTEESSTIQNLVPVYYPTLYYYADHRQYVQYSDEAALYPNDDYNNNIKYI